MIDTTRAPRELALIDVERALIEELVRLRRRRGLSEIGLRKRLGAHLVELCGVAPDDGDRSIRQKVRTAVAHLTTGLAVGERLALDAMLGVTPDMASPLLGTRLAAFADQLGCGTRTARRRIDDATERFAEAAAAHLARRDQEHDDPEKGWHVRRLDALLRLDTRSPELTERRTIVATRDGVKQIAVRFGLPARTDDIEARRDLRIDVAQGARVAATERYGSSQFRLVLELPRALRGGEPHTYTLVFAAPADDPIRDHYAYIPLVPCESFHVRVRFDPARRPRLVWRLDRYEARHRDGPPARGEQLAIDDVSEVALDFDAVELGYGYGVAWTGM